MRSRAAIGGILLVAAILRFYDLGENPPGFTCDEAAYGVGAASLLQTGKTIHGDSLPLYYHEKSFRHWDDPWIVYQPLHLYAALPFVLVFGKTVAAVRAVTVCFSLLGILGSYLLARTLFTEAVGLVTAILLTLSPWHVHLSRIGYEIMSLSTVLVWGAYFLWRGRSSRCSLIAGFSVLVLATYAYPPGRLFAPLLVLGFLIIQRRELWSRRADYLWAAAAAALVALPNLYVILTNPNQGRMYQLFIFTADVRHEPAIRFLAERAEGSGLWAAIHAHRGLRVPFHFACNWLSYFSPAFLYLPAPRFVQFGQTNHGMCLPALAPVAALGLYRLIRDRRAPECRFVLWWLLMFPVPASLTTGCPIPTRAITNFPVFELLSALGFWEIVTHPRFGIVPGQRPAGLRWGGAVATAVLTLGVLAEGAAVYRDYAVRYKAEAQPFWDSHGLPEALRLVHRLSPPEEQVVLSATINNAFLFVLFFENVDFRTLDPSLPEYSGLLPAKFIVAGPRSPSPTSAQVLWILRADEVPQYPEGKVVAQVPFADGRPHWVLLRTGTP